MIQSKALISKVNPENKRKSNVSSGGTGQYRRIKSIGKISTDLIGDMYTPIDSVNRFINLAIHTIGEDAQTRHFLLESKEGIRKMSDLLRRLDKYAKKLENEFKDISK
ncbi:MAG: hypothetical protein KKD29_08040 [Candidatus Omnitrophica bacterium]|nr:hypothetical protein [Candidatus Omnitrophota bacterium]MBU4488848.1 hypothetical protein [Candidatus Omnitrophota bacterium]